MPIPHPTIHGPSSYIPVEEVSSFGQPFGICYLSSSAACNFFFNIYFAGKINCALTCCSRDEALRSRSV